MNSNGELCIENDEFTTNAQDRTGTDGRYSVSHCAIQRSQPELSQFYYPFFPSSRLAAARSGSVLYQNHDSSIEYEDSSTGLQ